MNYILEYMRKNKISPTVENYIAFSGQTLSEVREDAETWCDILDLIEAGELKIVTPGTERPQ
jgi:hypothetical protein